MKSWSFLLTPFRLADGVEAVPPAQEQAVSDSWRVGFHPDRDENRPKEKTMRMMWENSSLRDVGA